MESLFSDDLGDHARVERTSSGGWVVPATLTRIGIFKYVDESGKTINVLRPKEEVLKKESLDSLAGCSVTVFHPAEREVTPKNWARVTKGVVDRSIQVVGDEFVASRLNIEDEDTGRRVDTRELCEVSCGYRADYALNPDGSYQTCTYQGQHVDRIQTNIRYNHVSLGPKNWGRAGRDVGIRLDGGSYYVGGKTMNFIDDGTAPAPIATAPATVVTPPAPAPVVTVDSVPRAEFDKLQARLDMVLLELAKPAVQAAPVVDSVAVAARATLVADAKVLAPALNCDSLADEDVRLEALKTVQGVTLAGKSKDYVAAAFDMAVSNRKKVVDSHQQVGGVITKPIVDASEDKVALAERNCRASYGFKPSTATA